MGYYFYIFIHVMSRQIPFEHIIYVSIAECKSRFVVIGLSLESHQQTHG